jgi:hypothetical protein
VLLTGNLAMFDSSAALESWTISNRCRRFYDFLDDRHGWSIFANDILQTKKQWIIHCFLFEFI